MESQGNEWKARTRTMREEIEGVLSASTDAEYRLASASLRGAMGQLAHAAEMAADLANDERRGGGGSAAASERKAEAAALLQAASRALVEGRKAVVARRARLRSELVSGASTAVAEEQSALAAARGATNTLARARAIMVEEVGRGEASLAALQESTATLRRVVDDHESIDEATATGRRLVTKMNRRERMAARLTNAALVFFLLVVLYIVVRRLPGYATVKSLATAAIGGSRPAPVGASQGASPPPDVDRPTPLGQGTSGTPGAGTEEMGEPLPTCLEPDVSEYACEPAGDNAMETTPVPGDASG